MFLGKPLSLLRANLPSRVEVRFVSDQHDGHIRIPVLADFLQPACQVGERVSPRYVIYQKGSCRSSVVRPRDALERFLTCSVPNLQLDVLFIDLNGASSELHSNCQIVLLSEAFVGELQQKTRLSDS